MGHFWEWWRGWRVGVGFLQDNFYISKLHGNAHVPSHRHALSNDTTIYLITALDSICLYPPNVITAANTLVTLNKLLSIWKSKLHSRSDIIPRLLFFQNIFPCLDILQPPALPQAFTKHPIFNPIQHQKHANTKWQTTTHCTSHTSSTDCSPKQPFFSCAQKLPSLQTHVYIIILPAQIWFLHSLQGFPKFMS